jgi:hypothetical protein
LNFNGIDGISLGTSRFDENWAKGSCLHLDDTSTHEKEVEVSICEFHDLLKNLI